MKPGLAIHPGGEFGERSILVNDRFATAPAAARRAVIDKSGAAAPIISAVR
jgi:hypothetical protein